MTKCTELHDLTDKPFAVNINLFPMMHPIDNNDYTDILIEKGVKIVETSGPTAVKEVKNLVKNCETMEINKYKEFTVEKIAELRVSDEGQEGINAFLEKRKPKWRG